MANLLKDGIAVIIGANSSLGEAALLAFIRDGCRNLMIGDSLEQNLEQTRSRIVQRHPDIRIVAAKIECNEEQSVEAFFVATAQQFGRIDFAVNIITPETAELEVHDPQGHFQSIYEKHLRTTFLCQRAELRQMSKQSLNTGLRCRGSIVNVTSLYSTIAAAGRTAYSGTQGGILGLSKTDAFDFGPASIRVNCVAHGNVEGFSLDSARGAVDEKDFAAKMPLRRLGLAEDIANAVVWLSSPLAAYITGISLPVDGGFALATGPP